MDVNLVFLYVFQLRIQNALFFVCIDFGLTDQTAYTLVVQCVAVLIQSSFGIRVLVERLTVHNPNLTASTTAL